MITYIIISAIIGLVLLYDFVRNGGVEGFNLSEKIISAVLCFLLFSAAWPVYIIKIIWAVFKAMYKSIAR